MGKGGGEYRTPPYSGLQRKQKTAAHPSSALNRLTEPITMVGEGGACLLSCPLPIVPTSIHATAQYVSTMLLPPIRVEMAPGHQGTTIPSGLSWWQRLMAALLGAQQKCHLLPGYRTHACTLLTSAGSGHHMTPLSKPRAPRPEGRQPYSSQKVNHCP